MCLQTLRYSTLNKADIINNMIAGRTLLKRFLPALFVSYEFVHILTCRFCRASVIAKQRRENRAGTARFKKVFYRYTNILNYRHDKNRRYNNGKNVRDIGLEYSRHIYALASAVCLSDKFIPSPAVA